MPTLNHPNPGSPVAWREMVGNKALGLLLAAAVSLAACGGETIGPGNPPDDTSGNVACSAVTEISLNAGQSIIVDPAVNSGCLRFPAAGAAGAEYLYMAAATNGREAASGTSTSYEVRGGPAGVTASVAPLQALARSHLQGRRGGLRPNTAFDAELRSRERMLAQQPGALALSRAQISAGAAAVPPAVGSQRTFKVCQTIDCTGFVDVSATAKYVSSAGGAAIYLDNTVPAGGYTQADLDSVGFLFDNYLYPLDTTSFGRESDLDNNGVVVVLLTNQVNALSPDCNTSGSVILGFFYGNDLLPGNTGSNGGEVFYGLVPDPSNGGCSISHEFARSYLGPTFIHEFQHMISYNQHVLVRGGLSEDTWLNEGLSHFAEEIGGRSIPDQYCVNQDCLTQFQVGDVQNAYGYLSNPEEFFLVEPSSSSGLLEERGANWLFVRWLVDQFGSDITGAAFTRALVATNKLGADNVAAATGVSFSTLVPQWQLANYLDDLPAFVTQEPRLRYTSWNFRATFADLHAQDPTDFPQAFPLRPDSITTSAYDRKGTLRAGSGLHLRVIQPPNSAAVTLQLTDSLRRAIGSSTAVPRIGIARVR
ncbi:MAG TPA: hypothetical protein VFK36_02875 [Gemmatimonadales bacterium]|nr:hypothetical protein [Gemmatimonadales bacterium]